MVEPVTTTTPPRFEPYQVILRPLITEKGTHLSERFNTYQFKVNSACNKEEIKVAVQALWQVRVIAVRTQIKKGKFRQYKARGGYTSDWKKAVVKLHADDRISLY